MKDTLLHNREHTIRRVLMMDRNIEIDPAPVGKTCDLCSIDPADLHIKVYVKDETFFQSYYLCTYCYSQVIGGETF